MLRTFLICALCLAIALIGVSGVHAHLAIEDHDAADRGSASHGEAHAHHGAHVVSVLDADHSSDHDDDGDIDIDPLVKAFGTLLLAALSLAVAILYVIAPLLTGETTRRVPFTRPLRPPRLRPRYFILPPSHAPPTPLS